jgi:hypothetical protein
VLRLKKSPDGSRKKFVPTTVLQAGWQEGVAVEPCDVPVGMKPVACWWD